MKPTGAARIAGVFGWPISHSRSPQLHKYWLDRYGIDGAYVPLAVRPEDFPTAVRAAPRLGLVGGNVTVPHKEAAFAACDHVDATAKRIGAVNTLIFEPTGGITGRNTDAYGFLENVRHGAPAGRADAGPAVVLGAGGSARAVVFGLIERGVTHIHVVNRTLDRAKALRDRFGAAVEPAGWEEASSVIGAAGLLVNTTSLGMKGQPPLMIDVGLLPAEAVVADLVYVPLVTSLLAAARARGLATADGLGMLLNQAVRGFSLWFGVKPMVTLELRALVEADLGGG